jgi:hypothetical protein
VSVNPQFDDGYFYDAVVTELDVARQTAVFTVGDTLHQVQSAHVECLSLGAVGRLRPPTDRVALAFHMYADQRLRRASELDDVAANRWGWRIGSRVFTVKLGVLPGRNGAVVVGNTEAISVEVPREFFELCGSRGLAPASVLRVFIADLCGLSSFFERPREDGYSSSGRRGRDSATAFLESAFEKTGVISHPKDVEPKKPRRSRRRTKDLEAEATDQTVANRPLKTTQTA